jgi:hypothetical protein
MANRNIFTIGKISKRLDDRLFTKGIKLMFNNPGIKLADE